MLATNLEQEKIKKGIIKILENEIQPSYQNFKRTRSLISISVYDEAMQEVNKKISQLKAIDPQLAKDLRYTTGLSALPTKDELLDKYNSK